MRLRIALSSLVLLVLGGCVLQSPKPNFDDTQGALLLGKNGVTYSPFTLDSGTWKPDGEDMKFVAVGKHYLVNDKAKTDQALFIPLTSEWWLIQFQDKSKESGYVFAHIQPEAIYIHPLTCDNLKLNAIAVKFVTFKKDDCFLAAHTTISDFKNLIPAAGPQLMKLVLKK